MRSLCKEIIREDENIITYKIFFPKEELINILKAKGIKRIFKGDQNLLWDGLITDIALKIALKDKIDFYPFVHDEKLGTGDNRLIPFYKDNFRFTITEDYAKKTTGAVYINQDISYGLFYGISIEPKDFKKVGFRIKWLLRNWGEYKEEINKDECYKKALESLGFSWNYSKISEITKSGIMANRDALEIFFKKNPHAEIYYLFSKSLGWYGIVPKYPEDISLSSIYLDDSNLLDLIKRLFILSVRGILRQVKEKDLREKIIERARKIKNWFNEFIKDKNKSLVDLQIFLAKKIIKDVYKDSIDLEFNTTSEMLKITKDKEIDNDFYYFFDLCLKYPYIFIESYNKALNKSGLDLKRLNIKNNLFYPPFFIEVFSKDEKNRKILMRCNLEISQADKEVFIRLFSHHCSSSTYVSKYSLNNACNFIKTLISTDNFPYGFSLIGKAGPFMAEMRRVDKVLAVPEMGSKYSPMVDYFLGELRSKNIDIPPSHLLRVQINILDNLKYLDTFTFKLPKFLSIYFGEEISNKDFSKIWRYKIEEIEDILKVFSKTEQGEYFHLAKIILYQKGYIDLEVNEKIKKYIRKVSPHIRRLENIKFPEEFLKVLKNLIEKRNYIISILKEKKEKSDKSLYKEKEFIEYKILFLFAVLIRSLLMAKESLIYINFRPYSLSLYLLGGEDLIKLLVENVKFNLEKVVFKI